MLIFKGELQYIMIEFLFNLLPLLCIMVLNQSVYDFDIIVMIPAGCESCTIVQPSFTVMIIFLIEMAKTVKILDAVSSLHLTAYRFDSLPALSAGLPYPFIGKPSGRALPWLGCRHALRSCARLQAVSNPILSGLRSFSTDRVHMVLGRPFGFLWSFGSGLIAAVTTQ